MFQLLRETIVPNDDKGHESAGKSPPIGPENHILDGSSFTDEGNKERRGAAPDNPIGPIVDSPVLSEAGLPQRIHIGGQSYEILDQVADGLESSLQDETCFTTQEQEVEQ